MKSSAVPFLGAFCVLAGGLLLSAAPPPASDYWRAEIVGDSMAPALHGPRIAFPCTVCQRPFLFDGEFAKDLSLVQCDACRQWQRVPEKPTTLPGDTVLVGPVSRSHHFRPGEIVAIRHPVFGDTVKRIAAPPPPSLQLKPDEYFVLGDAAESSIDSRDARFGPVKRSQIVGIIVKIERFSPSLIASKAKAK